ncbi:MAG: hypothetical protein F6K24_30675 [Okeania sp. SIO2D1]|nr:hypothetical protein [Okeania sp. SIO2D1]
MKKESGVVWGVWGGWRVWGVWVLEDTEMGRGGDAERGVSPCHRLPVSPFPHGECGKCGECEEMRKYLVMVKYGTFFYIKSGSIGTIQHRRGLMTKSLPSHKTTYLGLL